MADFPSSWQFAEAKQLCSELVDCINKTAPTVDFETPYKMIRTTNVKNGRINIDDAKCVTEATFIKWNRRLTPKRNDIVLTREAPLGDVGMIRTDDMVFLGQRTMLYRANPELLDQHFLYYTLLGPTAQAQIRTFGSGSTVEHVRVPDAEKITIPYPELAIQKKIAAILTTYDDLIEINKRRIALLEKMAEELYREWFVRLRFPGHQNTRFVKGVPEGWKVTPLSELGDFLNGFAFKPSHWGLEGVPIIKIKEMNGGITTETPRNSGDEIPKKYHFDDGAIIFSWSGTLKVMAWDQGPGLLNQHLFKVTPKKGIPHSFLLLALSFSIPLFEALTTGATMQHIKRKELSFVKVKVPRAETLKQFEDVAGPILRYKLQLTQTNRNLTKTRDLLLPRLISGKLSVEDLDIQFPPSMLGEADGGDDQAA